jgi:ribonuclease HI
MTAAIFCDGACRGNGTRHAVAGWAWALWPSGIRGEPAVARGAKLSLGAATNQRAELMALLEAIRHGVDATIYTDSMYAINCTSVWGPGWKRKGWKRDSGEPLQNLDLIQPLVELWDKKRWPLRHVRGHQTGSSPEAHGNNWVDRAAVQASLGETVFVNNATDVISHVEEAPVVKAPVLLIAKKATGPVAQADLRLWFK